MKNLPSMQGAMVGGASIIKSVTFTYKHERCATFLNNATSLTVDSAFLGDVPHYAIREPKLWTSGAHTMCM